MQEKKVPYWRAVLIGLLMPVLQIIIFYIRFQRVNQDSSLLDYILFFLAGTVGGLILIGLMRRSQSQAAKWMVVTAFILATPIALTGMIVGGLAGPIGVIFMSAMLWTIITGMGFFVGRFLSRNT